MNLIIAVITGLLFGSSIYLMLNRSFFRLIIGVILFGYGSVFFLFSVTGVTKNSPPLLSEEAFIPDQLADPLPQALALTAIVISIGVQIFVIILLKKTYENVDTEDIDDLNSTDTLTDNE